MKLSTDYEDDDTLLVFNDNKVIMVVTHDDVGRAGMECIERLVEIINQRK